MLDGGPLQRRPVLLDIVDGRCQRIALASHHVGGLHLLRREQAPGLRIGVGRDHVDTHHRVGALQVLGRAKADAIGMQRIQQLVGGEMGGKGVGQSEHRRQLRAEETGAQQPDRHLQSRPRNSAHSLL